MRDRFERPVNLSQFSRPNRPYLVGRSASLESPPIEEQKVLRMLVSSPYSGGLRLPGSLLWLAPDIEASTKFQHGAIQVRHPFIYVTVRHGKVNYQTDDLWHVDGFSIKYTHLPEANYISVRSEATTEWADQSFDFPEDFDPMRHNVHLFFQKRVRPEAVRSLESGQLYFVDPYVVHRRPPRATGWRTFIRISYTPIEIPDINNTPNPLIPTPHYVTDGVKSFRERLLDYDSDAIIP